MTRYVARWPLFGIPWSTRVYNCLKNNGITTIHELIKHTDHELLCLPNFGKVSLAEVRDMLAKQGLELGMKGIDMPYRRIESPQNKRIKEIVIGAYQIAVETIESGIKEMNGSNAGLRELAFLQDQASKIRRYCAQALRHAAEDFDDVEEVDEEDDQDDKDRPEA